jgi:hypothetical protein
MGWGGRLVVIGMLMLTTPAAGDYRADRRLSGVETYGRRVLRVYLARQRSSTCVGMPAERCLTSRGPADERTRSADGTERLIHHGTKTLYRGTGDSNFAVGPEWREWTIRDGRVIAAFEVVQVSQTGYPWLPSAAPDGQCETYGREDRTYCGDIEPVGTVPDLPPATKPPFDVGCDAQQRTRVPGKRRASNVTRKDLERMIKEDSSDLLAADGLELYGRWFDPPPELHLGQDWVPFLRNEDNELKFVTTTCATSRPGRLYDARQHLGPLVVAV